MTVQRCKQTWFALWIACVVSLLPTAAHAGPVEQLVELVFGPGDSPIIVARYSEGGGGLVVSPDGGRSWKLQCASAFLDPGAIAKGPMQVLANGRLLVPSSRGLANGDLSGCDWHPDFSGVNSPSVTGLQLDPTMPGTALALVTTYTTSTGQTQLMRRGVDGQWTPLGSTDDRTPIDLRVAVQAGKLRIYEVVSLETPDGGADAGSTYSYKLRVSDDGAATWHETALTVSDGTPELIGVDPMNADTVAVLIDGSVQDQVLISRDHGATLKPYLTVTTFGGMSWAPDGRVWIGDLGSPSGSGEKGLWGAANLDTAAVRMAMGDYPVQCVSYRPENNTLYVCQHFWLGVVDQTSGAFSRIMSFASVGEMVSCPGQNTADVCQTQLCNAYCGSGHFATAPVCGAYNTPSCGVPIAIMEGADWASAGSSAATAAGSGGVMAMAMSSAGHAGSATVAPTVTGPAAAGGPATAPVVTTTASGCTCGVVRASAAPRLLPWLALLLLFRLRRKRSVSSR